MNNVIVYKCCLCLLKNIKWGKMYWYNVLMSELKQHYKLHGLYSDVGKTCTKFLDIQQLFRHVLI